MKATLTLKAKSLEKHMASVKKKRKSPNWKQVLFQKLLILK